MNLLMAVAMGLGIVSGVAVNEKKFDGVSVDSMAVLASSIALAGTVVFDASSQQSMTKSERHYAYWSAVACSFVTVRIRF